MHSFRGVAGVGLLACSVILSGCIPPRAQVQPATTRSVDSVTAEIQARKLILENAVMHGDGNAAAAQFLEDGWVITPTHDSLGGREAIRAAVSAPRTATQLQEIRLSNDIAPIQICDDGAFEPFGQFTVSSTTRGQVNNNVSTVITRWQRDDHDSLRVKAMSLAENTPLDPTIARCTLAKAVYAARRVDVFALYAPIFTGSFSNSAEKAYTANDANWSSTGSGTLGSQGLLEVLDKNAALNSRNVPRIEVVANARLKGPFWLTIAAPLQAQEDNFSEINPKTQQESYLDRTGHQGSAGLGLMFGNFMISAGPSLIHDSWTMYQDTVFYQGPIASTASREGSPQTWTTTRIGAMEAADLTGAVSPYLAVRVRLEARQYPSASLKPLHSGAVLTASDSYFLLGAGLVLTY